MKYFSRAIFDEVALKKDRFDCILNFSRKSVSRVRAFEKGGGDCRIKTVYIIQFLSCVRTPRCEEVASFWRSRLLKTLPRFLKDEELKTRLRFAGRKVPLSWKRRFQMDVLMMTGGEPARFDDVWVLTLCCQLYDVILPGSVYSAAWFFCFCFSYFLWRYLRFWGDLCDQTARISVVRSRRICDVTIRLNS